MDVALTEALIPWTEPFAFATMIVSLQRKHLGACICHLYIAKDSIAMSQTRDPILDDLTEPQREAVTHIDGPLLVVAGAGSGKTRVITRRVAYLIRQGVSPYSILAITFTNKAANEMRERVEHLCRYKGMWVSTFHSFCARLLRRHADLLGHTNNFTIYDTADKNNCIKECMARLEMATANFRPEAIGAIISEAKNRLQNAEQFAAEGTGGFFGKHVAKVYALYERLLRANNAMDFDDLLMKFVILLREHPNVLQQYQRQFRYVLIDEYQDTNHAQYVIAKLLTESHRNFCATGDPDQSIYSWRGADIRNILDFEKDFPDAKVVRLEQNYRSTKNILRVASDVIRNNRRRKEKELWTENPLGEPVRCLACSNDRMEAKRVAEEVAQLRAEGVALSDVAIFYRTNAQSRLFEQAFREQEIPYKLVGAVEFFQRKEIKDLMAYLRVCLNEADDVATERIANVPTRGIGATTIQRLKDFAQSEGISLFQAMERVRDIGDLGSRAVSAVSAFVGLIRSLRAMPQTSAAQFIEQTIKKTNYDTYLIRLSQREETERMENVQELLNAAAQYDESEPEGGLAGFVQQVSLVSDVDNLEEGAEAVSLMTLHSAKGLEFPVVFIVGMEEGLLPHSQSIDTDAQLEEERRLCFVGITRAKERLVVTYAQSRTRFGKTEFAMRSRFLDEMPEDLLEEVFVADDLDWDEDDDDDDDVWHEEEISFQPGDRVRHDVYGVGVVFGASGWRANARVRVQFPTAGTKTLVVRYAGLEKVE